MNRSIIISLSLAALLASTRLLAATPIDESREANADIHVRVENIAGSVEVRAGDPDRVVITGSLGDGAKPLSIEGDRAQLTIEVESEDGGWGGGNMSASDLVIHVPPQARVDVDTVSADIDIDGVSGIHADVETVSGSIGFRADAQRVSLKSVSGSIDGEGAGRNWSVGTVSGRVRLPGAGGEVSVESVSGAIELSFREVERLRAETVSGRIVANGRLLPGGSVTMQSVSGSIELVLDGAVDARINAKTFSGGIDSDFGSPKSSGFGGGKALDTRAGDGSADIRLESFSGRIGIRKGS